MNQNLHGISHRGIFDQFDGGAGNDTHIQQMLPANTIPLHLYNFTKLTNFQVP